MTPVEVILDVIVISTPFFFVWRSPPDRTWRNAARLSLIAGLYVLVRVAVAEPVQFVLITAMVWAFVVVLLRYPLLLTGHSITDARIDRTLRQVVAGVNRERDRWVRVRDSDRLMAAQESTRRACALALAKLDTLPKTNDRWRSTINLVREYVTLTHDAALEAAPQAPGLGARGESSTLLSEQIEREWTLSLGRRRR